MSITELLEEQNIFERNKVPKEAKYLGIAMYFQTCSLRKTARVLSELYPVSRSAVWRWVKKVEVKMPIATEKKQRDIVLIDETVVKSKGLQYYVYSAIDKKRNEVILMRVYTTRNYLTSKSFIKETLGLCENKPKFIVDRAPWLKDALEALNLDFEHETFRQEKFS